MQNIPIRSLFYRYKGPLTEEGELVKCVENEDVTPEFMKLCKWLTDDIQVFTGVIETITGIGEC